MKFNSLQNILLIVFIFISVLSNYEGFNYIIYPVIIIYFLLTLFTTKFYTKSNIFNFIILYTVSSVFLQLLWPLINTNASYTVEHFSIYLIFMICFSVNNTKVKFDFHTLSLISGFAFSLIFFYTILFTPFQILGGRLDSEIVSLNFIGTIHYFSFISSIFFLINKKHRLVSIIVLISSISYMVLTGSRKDFILILGSIPLIYYYLKSNRNQFSFGKKILIFSMIGLLSFGALFFAFENLKSRFGDDYDFLLQSKEILSNQNVENSGDQRRSEFFHAIEMGFINPFGVGLGNIRMVTNNSINHVFSANSQHSDSIFAELIFSSGYLGLFAFLFYFFRFYYIIKFNSYLKDYFFIIFFVVISFFTFNVIHIKIFWVLLIVLEKQIQQNKLTRLKFNL